MTDPDDAIRQYSPLSTVDYKGFRVRAWAQRHSMTPTFYGVALVLNASGEPVVVDTGGERPMPGFSSGENAAAWALQHAMTWIDARMNH